MRPEEQVSRRGELYSELRSKFAIGGGWGLTSNALALVN